ncbi:hypothetical protein REPUB_Repub05bG0097500 [Reevesia pubescens]
MHIHTRWSKPDPDSVKVNFDGAINKPDVIGGTREIIGDSEGYVLGAISQFHDGIVDPLEIEGFAATRALLFASDMGFQNIILEGDALNRVNSLTSKEQDQSIIGNLILEGPLTLESSGA